MFDQRGICDIDGGDIELLFRSVQPLQPPLEHVAWREM